MKLIIAALVLSVTAVLHAADTPLVITQNGGELAAVINPALGTVTTYAIQNGVLQRRGAVNFLTDVQFLDSYTVAEIGGRPFSALELGGQKDRPTVQGMIGALPAQPTPEESKLGVPSLQMRARNAETAFWSKPHPYDGIVVGAMGDHTMMLVVPSMRAILVYEIVSDNMVLRTYRNYGAELYVPQVLKSSPTPEELIGQLPADVVGDLRKKIQAEMKAVGHNKSIALAPSQVYVGAGRMDHYIVLDYGNNHIMSYAYNGKGLDVLSVRNIEVDLLIPSSYKSGPSPQQIFAAFARDPSRMGWLAAHHYTLDVPALDALVEGSSISAGTSVSKVQANMSTNSNDDTMVVDFTSQRKLFTYTLTGGSSLDLSSARDYTIDVGLSLLDGRIQSEAYAVQLYKQGIRKASDHHDATAMLILRTALKLDPCLHKVLEKNKDVTSSLGALPAWQPMILDAAKACKALEDERIKEEAAAAEMRKAKAAAAAAAGRGG